MATIISGSLQNFTDFFKKQRLCVTLRSFVVSLEFANPVVRAVVCGTKNVELLSTLKPTPCSLRSFTANLSAKRRQLSTLIRHTLRISCLTWAKRFWKIESYILYNEPLEVHWGFLSIFALKRRCIFIIYWLCDLSLFQPWTIFIKIATFPCVWQATKHLKVNAAGMGSTVSVLSQRGWSRHG